MESKRRGVHICSMSQIGKIMTQCPACLRTIGFKAPYELCGTCIAYFDSIWDTSLHLRTYAVNQQRESAIQYEIASMYRDFNRRASAIEVQESAAVYAARARSILGITEET